MKRGSIREVTFSLFVIASIAAGYPRTVLFEGTTATPCTQCVPIHNWLDPYVLSQSRENLAAIEYHWWPTHGGDTDPWYQANITEIDARIQFYNWASSGVPALKIDGVTAPYSQTAFAQRVQQRMNVPARIHLSASAEIVQMIDSIYVLVSAVADSPLVANCALFAIIVERHEHWEVPAFNGQTDFYDPFVCFANGSSGTLLTHSGSVTDTVRFRFSTQLRLDGPEPVTVDNLAVVAFVQNLQTREIMQAKYEEVHWLPVHEPSARVVSFALLDAYPNPCNATTTIRYQLPQTENVRLDVVDLLGRSVKQLFHGRQTAGNHTIVFSSDGLASGVYVVRLASDRGVAMQKIVVAK